jgi:hypothetical protein
MRYLFLAVAMTAASGGAAAQPLTQQEALNEISSESTECFAYYSIANGCMFKIATEEQKRVLQSTSDRARQLSVTFGKATGVSDETLLARTRIALRSMLDMTSKSCLNVAIILEKYAAKCKALLEAPERRLQSLMMNGVESAE